MSPCQRPSAPRRITLHTSSTRALGGRVAVAECDRLVRHRDDDAVERRQFFGEAKEILDVRRPHLQRDHDGVVPA
jgi:hypothetical protein